MSGQNIQSFFERVESNPELQTKVMEIHRAAARTVAEGFAALGAESGVPFTVEEFLEVSSALDKEISESEMAGVAGGLSLASEHSSDDADASSRKSPEVARRFKVIGGHVRRV